MNSTLYGKKYPNLLSRTGSASDTSSLSGCGCHKTVSTKVSAWHRTVSKTTFLKELPAQGQNVAYNVLEQNMGNSIGYLMVNNHGRFEEYIDVDGTSRYVKLSEHPISKSGTQTKSTIRIEQKENTLYLNGQELVGFTPFLGFDGITVHDDLRLTCCGACFAVHGALGLHQLDCICCIGSCNFGCEPFYDILWSVL